MSANQADDQGYASQSQAESAVSTHVHQLLWFLSFTIALRGTNTLFHQRLSTDAPAELSAVVDELLNSLTTKFNAVSGEIFTKC